MSTCGVCRASSGLRVGLCAEVGEYLSKYLQEWNGDKISVLRVEV